MGTGAFREETSWKVAHNVWLRFAAELGLIGLGLFLLLLLLLFVRAWRRPGTMRQFSFTVLTVWMIGATFYNAEDKKQTWLVLSLVLIGTSLATGRGEGGHAGTAAPRGCAPPAARVVPRVGRTSASRRGPGTGRPSRAGGRACGAAPMVGVLAGDPT